MIRILTVAVVAALIAAPANAQSIRVATTGKTPAQLSADIAQAAKKVCNVAVIGASFPREMYARCYKAVMANAITEVGDPAVAAAAGIQLAQR